MLRVLLFEEDISIMATSTTNRSLAFTSYTGFRASLRISNTDYLHNLRNIYIDQR